MEELKKHYESVKQENDRQKQELVGRKHD